MEVTRRRPEGPQPPLAAPPPGPPEHLSRAFGVAPVNSSSASGIAGRGVANGLAAQARLQTGVGRGYPGGGGRPGLDPAKPRQAPLRPLITPRAHNPLGLYFITNITAASQDKFAVGESRARPGPARPALESWRARHARRKEARASFRPVGGRRSFLTPLSPSPLQLPSDPSYLADTAPNHQTPQPTQRTECPPRDRRGRRVRLPRPRP